MKLKLFYLLACLFVMNTTDVMAWGTTGHRVVAEVAEQNLSKKAKKSIGKIIGNQKLAYWANWPDFVKSDAKFKMNDGWHYVNIEPAADKATCLASLELTPEENLYKKLQFLVGELKNNNNLTEETKQQYLYYIIHMVGDAHQPMHVGRAGDLGGNKVTVEWFGERTNIHTLWDSKLVDFEKYSYTEYANVLNIIDKDAKSKIQAGTLGDWLYESHVIANGIYAEAEKNTKLKYEYHYLNKEVVENQMLKGGLRLARILNEIYS